MRKTGHTLASCLAVLIVLVVMYLALMPQWTSETEEAPGAFSVKRAISHIREISAAPHYVGSTAHAEVAQYIQKTLRDLGLNVTTQTGMTLTSGGLLVRPTNIIARIKGTGSGKALLLLSHYDSAPHSYSRGAADDGTGVAVILEGLRAFLHNKTPHNNDIIVLFSDAEELGLNGAALFVTKNPYVKDVGLVLNFEARGTSGPGYMLMEVNQGNAGMTDAFADAAPHYPVANSLMYSIYKMMPNDTDLTVFRESGKIQGFNFAFIDSHFNYHTQQDDLAHLSPKTIAHQASYLMPLLIHFASANLGKLETVDEQLFFNAPFLFIHYPFSWIWPMLIAACTLFLFFVFIGLGKRTLQFSIIGKGFLTMLLALALAGVVAFFGWKLLLSIYPQYTDIQQGFTYNGHLYIAAFISLSLALAFLSYSAVSDEIHTMNYTVAPLFIWLMINIGLAMYLPGGAFFIIPLISALLMLAWFVITQKTNTVFNLLMSVPALVIFVPYIVMFPIGLGLKILAGSAILTVLVFTLLLPVFGQFSKKWLWSLVLFLVSVTCFVRAHFRAGYDAGTAKPNSLLYVYDADTDKAVWASYDNTSDDWTKIYLGDNPQSADKLNKTRPPSKYDKPFTFQADALVRDIKEPTIDFLVDSVMGKYRFVKIRITPNREVNKYDIFADPEIAIHNLQANGASPESQKGSLYRHKGNHILSYYVVDNEPLLLSFMIPAGADPALELLESSFDLMQSQIFRLTPRKPWMMPAPFVLNDAVVIRKKIRPAPKLTIAMPVKKNFTLPQAADTIPDTDNEPTPEIIPAPVQPN